VKIDVVLRPSCNCQTNVKVSIEETKYLSLKCVESYTVRKSLNTVNIYLNQLSPFRIIYTYCYFNIHLTESSEAVARE
jgi:hypothetical protein